MLRSILLSVFCSLSLLLRKKCLFACSVSILILCISNASSRFVLNSFLFFFRVSSFLCVVFCSAVRLSLSPVLYFNSPHFIVENKLEVKKIIVNFFVHFSSLFIFVCAILFFFSTGIIMLINIIVLCIGCIGAQAHQITKPTFM